MTYKIWVGKEKSLLADSLMTVLDDSTIPVMPVSVDLHVCVSVLSWLKSLEYQNMNLPGMHTLGTYRVRVLDGFNSACHPCLMRSHSPVSQCSNAARCRTRKSTLWSALAGRQSYRGRKHWLWKQKGARIHGFIEEMTFNCASWSWFSTDGQNSNYEYD